MGASQISDNDLIDLGISFEKVENSESRKLLIPTRSLENYKVLVRGKLDKGFWNDIAGENCIYFIFKMPDGEIREFEYSEEKRLEIANLCTQLNKDPIEKTSNLLDYLGENEFYSDEVVNYRRSKSTN